MDQEVNYLNSQEAAKVLGVNVSSIKRWTDQGRLHCIQTAGGHRKFLMSHLAQFLADNEKKASKANVFEIESEQDLRLSYYIIQRDFKYLTKHLFSVAKASDRVAVFKILSALYLSQYPLYKIYDDLITPVLYQIGQMWVNDELSVVEEHITTNTIREGIARLQGIISVREEKTEIALCLNLSSEMHDMALKMIENVLELRGFYTYLSGQMTPLLQTEHIFKSVKPDRLYISSTFILDLETAQKEVNFIFEMCEVYASRAYVGGQGWDQLSYDHPVVEKRLYSFEEIYIS
jgi:excisionase family DNA binding protein